MNYKKIIFAAACVASVSALAQKPCKIEGEATNGASCEKVYVYIENENGGYADAPDDSIVVKGGKFTYTSTLKDVRQAYFMARMAGGGQTAICTYLIPGEKGKLTFDNKEFFLTGTKFYKEWDGMDRATTDLDKKLTEMQVELEAKIEAMSEEEQKTKIAELIAPYRELYEERNKVWGDYFKAHSGEEGCVMFCLAQGNYPVNKLMETVGDKLKGSRVEGYLNKKLEIAKAQQEAQAKEEAEAKAKEDATGEGKMFTDFEAEYNGKIQKLSDYVGKGKYVLVDFWASWCGPCRAEIPNLIEAYNKYKGDKFDVLGVATWDKPKDTEKAIEDMKIPYPQIMNAQKAGSDAYGILGIPQIILFGPDGTIVKRNLRGAVIEETLKGIFGK